ncbi:metallophosphoesterase [Clostridium sp. 19966]|uniref:Phosphodiesterase n=1 Tax=Clostridium butyricum TaxID=1492 RepID=A0A6N2ZYD8_CLOBU|nr:metallophosphoesterase [Clostridium sp. 19966]MDT8717017.1 metallophosphoesterase [Clostridium sp. 19966]
MKVFVTSDIHGRFNVLNKIIEFVKERQDIDCIILCGDITGDHVFSYFYELEDKQYEDYKIIKDKLQQLNRKVLFIQGNHDVFTVDKSDITYLPYCKTESFNNFIAIEYVNFLMYGTKREGNEQDMICRLSKLNIDNKSIIISHLPPYKCLDKANNGVYYGSGAIRDMIKEKKPAYFFCGHVHDSFGFKKLHNTFVFNAACNKITTRGWVVNLETAKYEKVIL